MTPFPVDLVLDQVTAAWRQGRDVVLRAPTGAGKTTRVPPALLDELSATGALGTRAILLVQPRRLAARAAARRIAAERHSPLGQEVGYIVRFDSCVRRDTRLIVATEGILLRMLIDDPLLERLAGVVFDEFHERNLASDLALGMVRRIQEAVRPDLRIVVMSATLDPQPIAAYLPGSQVVETEGRLFPVDVEYLKQPDRRPLPQQIADAVGRALRRTSGDVLVFLPGVGEIRQAERELESLARQYDLAVMTLFGDLPPEQQDAVLLPGPRRKVVLATNVAETSLTIEGVAAVVDSGLARVLRHDPAVGLDRLEVVPISRAAADQRAGRAGRLGPGICLRLWESRSHQARAEFELPEVRRLDMSGPVLQLRCCGEAPRVFPWFEAPDSVALDQADALLRQLGALDDAGVTPLGKQMVRLPVQPRLARLLIAANELGQPAAGALAAAYLAERDPFLRFAHRDHRPQAARSATLPSSRQPPSRASSRTDSDVADRLEALVEFQRTGRREFPQGELNTAAARYLFQAQRQLGDLLGEPTNRRAEHATAAGATTEFDDAARTAVMRALLAAFPDRVARRRGPHDDRGVLGSGRGVKLAAQSAVKDGELFLCVDVDGGGSEASVRQASLVQPEWLTPDALRTVDEHFFHPTRKQVAARRRTYWNGVVLEETGIAAVRGGEAAGLLFQAARPQLDQLVGAAVQSLLRRLRFLRRWMPELQLPPSDQAHLEELLRMQCDQALSFDELRQANWVESLRGSLDHHQLRALERDAPERIEVPSGSRLPIQYDDESKPVLAVRIQEVFGWRETPRLAGGRVPLLLHLLAPNHRPQQVTDDLGSFWQNTYAQVRKDLRARYPKHAWPEDPLAAAPESRPRKK